MILLISEMKVLPGKRKEVIQTLQHIANICRSAKGCVAFGVYQDIEDENFILKSTLWKTKRDVKTHLNSEHHKAFLGMGKTLCSSVKHHMFCLVGDINGGGNADGINRDICKDLILD